MVDVPVLKARERRAITLLAEGHSHTEIGHTLDCSPAAVTMLLGRLYERLGTANAAHTIATLARAGILTDSASLDAPNPGPNGCLPCGTASARRRHLAHAERCIRCGVEGVRDPENAPPRLLTPIRAAA